MAEIKKDAANFAPGDIVQLKSFGPPMTVVSVVTEGVNTIWYDEVAGDVRTTLIPAVALDKIDLSDVEGDEEEDEDDEWREEARAATARKKRRRDS